MSAEQVDEMPPHADAGAADFAEGEGTVYALIGEIFTVSDDAGTQTHHLLVGQDLTRQIEDSFLPLMWFFSTPRYEHQAVEWLEWAGAPAGLLKQMVKLGYLAQVETRSATTAAKSLKGLRIATQGSPGEMNENGYYALVTAEESDQPVPYVSPELATALWSDHQGLDVPTLAKMIGKATGLGRELAAYKMLVGLPVLLDHGYARLECLHVPNQ